MRLEYYILLKKGFIFQSEGAHIEKICRRGKITFHFLAVLRAAEHGLYTSNLLPTPMQLLCASTPSSSGG